ncbi:hypothetical protein LB507_010825 [Fusarium sp. FIESC RH6]|nr:hypothetical protein LB507_010825 [Fusarium sp. FIESC RH6]
MQITKLSLFAAAMAGSVNAAKRDIDACTSAASGLVEVMSDMPTADKTLESFLAKQTDVANIAESCTIPAVTGSMAAAYTSYAKSMVSWVSEMKEDISSVYDACSDVPEVNEQLSSYAIPVTGFCSTFVWATASATETGTATAKATNSGAEATTGSVSETAASTATPTSVAENSGASGTGLGIVAVAAIAGLAVAGAY